MSRSEIITQLENCIFGDYKFLYISPERISSDIFVTKLSAMKVCMIAVDESHCISQWGYDFRPSYLGISAIRDMLPGVPVLALTATATPTVADDIQERLGFKQKNVFRKSFLRKNLSYIVRRTDSKEKELEYILSKVPGCAIVYVRNRKLTREIAENLREAGINAEYYHAGLSNDEKTARQDRWKNNQTRVIVSTNAFGMGIDKPDVRLVVHMNMPSSLEEYYQEAGRAGRDEKRAYAVALIDKNDVSNIKRRLATEFPPREFILRVYEALGNYYQIAVGFGLDTAHDFDLAAFCESYKLPVLQTHHALRILEMSGYIEYAEEQDYASRVMITSTKEELYDYLRQDKERDGVLMTILREYTGMFSDYAYIDEATIAKRIGLTSQRVYEILLGLSKYRIIKYVPHKRTPLIIYTKTREEQRYVSIPRSAYEERMERSSERMVSLLEYIEDDTRCRSKLLVSYFGEKEAEDCGCCDVCIAKKKATASESEVESIRRLLLATESSGPFPMEQVIEMLPYPRATVEKVVRHLLENDRSHFTLSDGYMLCVNKV
jgi:ATP-dependent DNA helicase RecQ